MENITVTTAGNHVAVLKPFITGAEAEAVTTTISDSASLAANNIAATHAILNAVAISIDGATDDVVTKMRALPVLDYSEIVARAVEIATGAKKEPSTPTT